MSRIPSYLTAALLCGAALSSIQAAPFDIDRPFPPLILPTLDDGAPKSLADFRGRKTVLHVFASW